MNPQKLILRKAQVQNIYAHGHRNRRMKLRSFMLNNCQNACFSSYSHCGELYTWARGASLSRVVLGLSLETASALKFLPMASLHLFGNTRSYQK